MNLKNTVIFAALFVSLCGGLAHAAELPSYDIQKMCDERETEKREKAFCAALQWSAQEEIRNRMPLKAEFTTACTQTNEYFYTGLATCLNEKLIMAGELPIYNLQNYCILNTPEGEMERIDMIACFGTERWALAKLLKHQPFDPEKLKKCEDGYDHTGGTYTKLGQCLLLQ